MMCDRTDLIDVTKQLPEEAQYYTATKKHIIVNFDEYLDENTGDINVFELFGSHRNVIDKICHYSNWFIHHYDEDKDILNSLLNIKCQIDKPRLVYTESAFFADIEDIFTDKIKNAILQMVEDQYLVDLEDGLDEDAKNYNSNFKNEHGVMVLAAMVASNLLSPAANHFAIENKDPSFNKKNFMMLYTTKMINVFERDDVEIVNKLFMLLDMKLNESKIHKKMWDRQKNQSNTETLLMIKLLKVTLADVLHKVVFEGNLVKYIIVAAEDNIKRAIIGRSAYDSYIIDVDKTQGELSALELIDMNHVSSDENHIIYSEIETNSIDKMFKRRPIFITKEEFKSLRKNLRPNQDQIQLVSLFVSSKLNNFNNNLNQEQYIKAALIMRHELLNSKYTVLPDIILANPKSSVKRRVSSRIISKIYESSLYKVLENQYTDCFGSKLKENDKKDNPLVGIFLDLNSWVFESQRSENFEEEINRDVSSAILSHELLRFILSI